MFSSEFRSEITLFERLGGTERLAALVDAFYRRVAADPLLSPIFPEDLTETRAKQLRFLTQFTGGPPLYSERYGPPRLRARHLPFPITPERATAWLKCMAEAMDEVGLSGPARDDFWRRLVMTAHHMVNTESTA